jgi:AcrR family transcriptional regulator
VVPVRAGSRADAPRLDGDRERAILSATYDLLGEVGYEGLRLDAVAARARASKATLYRHWPTKAQLVADAVRICHVHEENVPDTGSLRGDLVAWFTEIADSIDGHEGSLMCGLIMAINTDAEFAAQMRALRSSKTPIAAQICSRAAQRGEIQPGCHAELIDEIVPGLLFSRRFIQGAPLDVQFVEHSVDDIILPLLKR